MQLVSYAQNREDIVLHRALSDKPKGFYIDIGANDPCLCSLTRHFYERGWNGINVEPGKTAFRRLVRQRRRDINLNVGISNQHGTLCFYESPTVSTYSTFSAEEAELLRSTGLSFEERRVPVITLSQLCERHVHTTIDFMSIDVENHEHEVIQGGDWKRWRPRVVVVEDSLSPTGIRNHGKWEPFLLAADYLLALCDGINRFYLRQEDKHLLPLLSVPANISDDFILYDCLDGVGPTGLAIARRLHSLAHRHPRIAAVVKWLGYLTYRGMKKALTPFQLRGKGRGQQRREAA
jgi:FkbM family methyltransferase